VLLTEYYLVDWIKKNETGGACSAYGRGEADTGCWWGNLKERDNVEDLVFDGRIILKWVFKKRDGEARTGSIGLNIGKGGGFF
jgi:hypothetical protein